MGTHPIFESDFDCLTDIDSYSFNQEQVSCCSGPRIDMIEMDPLVGILLIIPALLLLGLVIKKFQSGRNDDSVLFVGLSASGKTYMVTKLVNEDSDPETRISITSNIVEYNPKEDLKKLKLIDIPGSERMRLGELEKYKGSTRGIVFVINSETISKDIRDVAEMIFSLLTDSTIYAKRPKILLAANHQDTSLAKAGSAIKSLLEKELNLLRKTQAAQLKDTDEKSKTDVQLGKSNVAFSFSHLPNDVEVHECSAKNCDLDAIHSWLYSCCF